MWYGSQVVAWPLLTLFTWTCLSLSDSNPEPGSCRAPGLWGPPDSDDNSFLVLDMRQALWQHHHVLSP